MTPTSPPYNVQIGVGNFVDLTFDDGSNSYLTMLIDPRASVHATTAILPSLILDLPAQFVEPALSAMDVTFHVGPLLSSTMAVQTAAGDTDYDVTVLMPRPSENNGTWSWLEQNDAAWTGYAVKSTDEKANFSNVQSILRTGLLKLSGAMKNGGK